MSDSEHTLVLMPVQADPVLVGHIPGSSITQCSKCGIDCWIAPSGRATLYPRICVPCALASDEEKEMGIHATALDELADAAGVDVRNLRSTMRRAGWEIWD